MEKEKKKTKERMEVPSQTLYVNNINEKIKKNALKTTLYALFSQFGKVIEIVACRGIKLRGQVSITQSLCVREKERESERKENGERKRNEGIGRMLTFRKILMLLIFFISFRLGLCIKM